MDGKTERMSFLTLRGSESGLTLVNTDALVRKTEQQQRQIKRKNQLIAELEGKIRELEDAKKIYNAQRDDKKLESKPSFLRNLVAENEALKERLTLLATKNEELAHESVFISEEIKWKTNHVLFMEERITAFEEHLIELQGFKNGVNHNSEEEETCSHEYISVGKIFPTEIFEQMNRGPMTRKIGISKDDDILEESFTIEDDFIVEGDSSLTKGSAAKEYCSVEQTFAMDADNDANEDYDGEDDSFTEGESTLTQHKVAENEVAMTEEDLAVKEDFALMKDFPSMEDFAANDESTPKEESQNSTEEEAALSTKDLIIDPERDATEKSCKSGLARDGEDVFSSMTKHFMSFFEKKIWKKLEDSESAAFNQCRADFERNPVAAVSHEIMKLKRESCDLLNAEANFKQEELRDTKTLKEELKKERDFIKRNHEELESDYKNIYTRCEGLEKMYQSVNKVFKDLEQTSLQTDKAILKIKGENKILEEKKEELRLKTKQVPELECKLKKWSEICGKLYLFLQKDNVEVVKLKERCESISQLAKIDGFRRRRLEKKLKRVAKQNRAIRKAMAQGRKRMHKVMGRKTLDMQIMVERLQYQISQLSMEKDKFEECYKCELGFGVSLAQEAEGLRCKVRFYEEALEGERDKIEELIKEKKVTREELERVRDIKRYNGRRVEELMKDKDIIGQEAKDKDKELMEIKRGRDDFKKQLEACNEMLSNMSKKLEIECCMRHNLQLCLEEEKRCKVITQKQLSTAVSEVNEVKELLENAAIEDEENEGMVEALEQRIVEMGKKKKGELRCWFSKKLTSNRDSESRSKRDSETQ